MTLARRLVPKQVHFAGRRIRDRRALLQPTPEVVDRALYALGCAQLKAPGVKTHALCLEVTHKHEAVTDAADQSQLSTYFQEQHSLLAKSLNAHYGTHENVWGPGSYSNVETHTPYDLEQQLVYVWTQPVKDGLVKRPEDWRGVPFFPEDFGKTFVVPKPEGAFFGSRRPKGFEPTYPPALRAHRKELRRQAQREKEERDRRDRRRGRSTKRRRQLSVERARRRERKDRAARPPRDRETLPKEVKVTISPPPGYEDMTLEEVRVHFRELLEERIKQIHAERKAEGKHWFKGQKRVLSRDARKSIGDPLPSSAINPRIACKDPTLRRALLRGLQIWRSEYKAALARWRAQDREVRFPWGAYLIPTLHGAQTEVPPRGPPLAA